MLSVDKGLQDWIIDNAARGCALESMVESMVAAGHARDFARGAIAQVLAAGAGDTGKSNATLDHRAVIATQAQTLAAERAHHVPASVPEPLPAGAPTMIDAGDRRVTVVSQLKAPRIIVFGNVLSDAECDELIELSRSKLARSLVVDPKTGKASEHAERSSEGTYFQHDEHALVARIDNRIAAITRWPVENGEALQILHYKVGGEYRPHYDYFDPADPGSPQHLALGGNRVGTFIVYLAAPEEGGGTAFPDIGFEVAALRGHAVFFNYDIPAPASLTLHAGTPVVRGEKWIATKWLRERRYGAP